MKRILAVILCAVTLFSMCGCAALQGLFVGIADSQWSLTEMNDNGVQLDQTFLEEKGVTGSISFDDKDFALELQGNEFNGTYVLNGDQLTLTIGEETVNAICDDGVITMTIDGAVLTFTEQ